MNRWCVDVCLSTLKYVFKPRIVHSGKQWQKWPNNFERNYEQLSRLKENTKRPLIDDQLQEFQFRSHKIVCCNPNRNMCSNVHFYNDTKFMVFKSLVYTWCTQKCRCSLDVDVLPFLLILKIYILVQIYIFLRW